MLPKSTLYLLKSMTYLAKLPRGEYAGAKKIGQELSIPSNYLGKILQTLAKKGYLVSRKGLGGGFNLAKDPKNITMLEIIEVMHEETFMSGCFWGKEIECSDIDKCEMHDKWKNIVTLTRNIFKTTTISDLKTGDIS